MMLLKKEKLKEILLAMVYPARCPLCDDLMLPGEKKPCGDCLPLLEAGLQGNHCMRCGKFISTEEEYCGDCKRRQHDFDGGWGLLPYQKEYRQAMVRFKFHGRQEYGAFYGRFMAEHTVTLRNRWNPQVILPVPMHKRKEAMRGYNQAGLLAEYFSKSCGIPVRNDLIKRVGRTKPMKELNPNQRRANLRQAFTAKEEVQQYKRVLLLDDIYTTGSTADALARILKEKGVKKVYILTLCTGIGF